VPFRQSKLGVLNKEVKKEEVFKEEDKKDVKDKEDNKLKFNNNNNLNELRKNI
jgi:hypothetical protein